MRFGKPRTMFAERIDARMYLGYAAIVPETATSVAIICPYFSTSVASAVLWHAIDADLIVFKTSTTDVCCRALIDRQNKYCFDFCFGLEFCSARV